MTGSKASKAWRERNPEYYHHYSQAYFRYKHDKALSILGNRCFVCGRQYTRMEIHHLNYENGVPSSQWKTYTDVEKNPGNYRLLCVLCHRFLTLAMTEKGTGERFQELLRVSKPKMVIQSV